MSATCEICGKEFKTTQGRRGHMTFVHGMSKGEFSNLVTRVATDQKILPAKQVQQLTSIVDEITELRSKLKELSESQKDLRNQCQRNYKGQITTTRTDDKILERVSRLEEKLERLSRFVQYEIVGISNDIVWSFILDRPKLKKRVMNTRHSLPDGRAVFVKTK